MKIAIIGGGLAGLSLGYFLYKNGYDFLILEKDPKPGGLLKSTHINNFTFDIGGSHIIFSKNREILNFMVSLLGDNVRKIRRNTKILYHKRYIKYPFENGLSGLPVEENYECLLYFIKNLIKKEKGMLEHPKNMKDWFYYTFGKGIAEKYLIPYNEKIWKYPLEKMSTVWVERIPQPPIEDIIKSSLGISTEGYTHQLYFYYPITGGIESLIKSITKSLNSRIITRYEVKTIKKEDGKWIISNGHQEFEFEEIISTIPPCEIIKSLNSVPIEIINAINKLKYNSLITVGIGVDKRKISDFSWLYIPDKDIITHRISFPSNYSPRVTPEGKSSILAEITYREGDEISKMNDQNIAEMVIEDLSKLGILNKNDVILTTVNRFKYAYVLYDLDYRHFVDLILTYLNNMGIHSIGRFGSWKYANMDSVIEMAKSFVNKIYPKNHKRGYRYEDFS